MTSILGRFMDFLFSHSNEEWERFIVWLIMMAMIYYIIFKEDHLFKIGFKGHDKLWQAAEAIVYIFIYLIPGVLLSNFLLGYAIDDKAMWIIEIILLTALGIRGALEGIKTWKNGHKKDEDTPITGQ